MKPIDFSNLEKMIEQKYISVQKHPTLDLYILNYTHRAQFDRVWNNETLQCRGLIMTGDNEIVSRPFPKFFNWSELPVSKSRHLQKKMLANEIDFTITEKLDGSLGISYFDSDGRMHIATRGSFVSDQAKKANEIWQTRYSSGPTYPYHKRTFLFEIIYPQNRIVVDYAGMEDLVLLAIIDTETGIESDYETLRGVAEDHKMPVVAQYDGLADFSQLEQKPNSEGYVVYFPKQKFRAKIKFAEYVRLHRILTGINAKRIWEILSAGQSLDEILDRVPDEFFKWVQETRDKLLNQYAEIEREALEYYFTVLRHKETRKEQAQFVLGQRGINSSVLFNMLDRKDYSAQIWKLIEPKYETPFKVDEA